MKEKEEDTKKKVCLISSSGGHFEQLMMLKQLEEKFDVFIVTEKTYYNKDNKNIKYFLPQVNRKEKFFMLKMIKIYFKSLKILKKEKPDVIISTGVLSTIPMLYLGHKKRKKVIYIESFAKISDPTQTGKFVYNHNLADRFYVQWESMLKFYPNAIFKGGIY